MLLETRESIAMVDVKLSREHERYIKSKIESGEYKSADEAVADALQLLMEADALDDEKLQRMKKAVEKSRASGAVEDFSMEKFISDLDPKS